VNGSIVQAHNLEIQKVLREEKKDLLSYVIFDLRNRFKSNAPEVIVPVSAHPCFEKAAHYLSMKLNKVPLREDFRADTRIMEQMINEKRKQF